jgi:hypothetical protein
MMPVAKSKMDAKWKAAVCYPVVACFPVGYFPDVDYLAAEQAALDAAAVGKGAPEWDNSVDKSEGKQVVRKEDGHPPDTWDTKRHHRHNLPKPNNRSQILMQKIRYSDCDTAALLHNHSVWALLANNVREFQSNILRPA